MEDQSATALEAVPEAIVEAPAGEQTEGQTEGQAEGQAAEGDEPEEVKKSKSAERRERDKARQARIAEERDALAARLASIEAQREKVLQAAKAQKEPTEADYPDPFDLQTARMLWGVEQKLMSRDANQVDEAAKAVKSQVENLNQQESAAIAEAWAAQVAEAKTRYSDFEKVAHFAPISDEVARMVATSDVGADVAYYLGQNHALARSISAMHPVEAARAIGRIEATLTLPKPRTETNAPAPINPVRGSAGAGRDPAKMSYAEFKAYRERGGTIGPRS